MSSPFLASRFAWFRRQFAWSNSVRSWQERITVLLLVAAAVLLVLFRQRLHLTVQIALWVALAVGTAVGLRRGWLKLFGPVVFYDLIRSSRRGGLFLMRGLYALLLLLLLMFVYSTFLNRQSIPAHEMAAVAASFFYTFVWVQFLVVVLVTPAYVGGAIADEKERRTLEFLLATDLANREIVLGKLASRFLSLTLLILTGLPILSLLQLVGGVDPELMLATFAATGVTMLSIAGTSLAWSVFTRRSRDAIALTYLTGIAYFGSASLLLMVPMNPALGGVPLLPFVNSPYTVNDLVEWVNAGNIFYALGRLGLLLGSGGNIADILGTLLRDYVIFHILVASVTVTWSVLRIRAVALLQSESKPGLVRRVFHRRLPPIRIPPMCWKEIHAEPGLRFHWAGYLLIGLLVLLSFVPLLIMFANIRSWRFLHEGVNIYVRTVGTIVACLLLLGVAIRAAGSVTGERDRQTLDSLLLTPLESGDIYFAKWLGSVLSVRMGWIWLGAIWLVGLLTGGLLPFSIPLLLGTWVVYACFMASLGLWFSTRFQSTLKATLATLLSVCGLAFGHWLLWMCCIPIFMATGGPRGGGGRMLQEVLMFQAFALTPPLTLGMFAFRWEDIEHVGRRGGEEFRMVFYGMFGLVIWFVGAVLIGLAGMERLRQVTGRAPLSRAEIRDRIAPPAPRRRGAAEPVSDDEPIDVLDAEPPPPS